MVTDRMKKDAGRPIRKKSSRKTSPLLAHSSHTFLEIKIESYYKGIRSSQISNKGTTKYKWGFAKKIGKEDQNQVDSVRDSIDTMTNVRFANEVSRQTGVSTASSLGGGGPSSSSSMGPPRRSLGPTMPPQGPGPRWPRTADEGKEKVREKHIGMKSVRN